VSEKSTSPTTPVKLMRREDYKRIKGFNREQMSQYINRIWTRGYHAGVEEVTKSKTADKPAEQVSE